MILLLCIKLYTSRIVLEALGVEDYGIFVVVGGTIAMLSFFTGTLSTAISRYLTFSLGTNHSIELRKTFSTSFTVMIIIALFLFIIAETIGPLFVKNILSIPVGRETAAIWCLHCSILVFVINLLYVPFNALIIAHERMVAFSYISIVEVILQFSVALSITISTNRLEIYSFLLVIVAIVIFLTYLTYCKIHFAECSLQLSFDKSLIRGILSFSGWNLIGTGVYILNTQGINLLSNVFFGVTINAARGISDHVQSVLQQFVMNFTTALNPQIVKSYAKSDFKYMNELVCKGAKYSLYLSFIVAIPFLFETEMILKIWLGNYPPYSPTFVRLTVICAIIDFVGNTTARAVWATGNVKEYYIKTGIVSILVLPLSYIAFKLWGDPKLSYYVFAFIYSILIPLRLYILKKLVNFSPLFFLKTVLGVCIKVLVLSLVFPTIAWYLLPATAFRMVILTIGSIMLTVLFAYLVGMTSNERLFVKKICIEKCSTIKKLV